MIFNFWNCLTESSDQYIKLMERVAQLEKEIKATKDSVDNGYAADLTSLKGRVELYEEGTDSQLKELGDNIQSVYGKLADLNDGIAANRQTIEETNAKINDYAAMPRGESVDYSGVFFDLSNRIAANGQAIEETRATMSESALNTAHMISELEARIEEALTFEERVEVLEDDLPQVDLLGSDQDLSADEGSFVGSDNTNDEF